MCRVRPRKRRLMPRWGRPSRRMRAPAPIASSRSVVFWSSRPARTRRSTWSRLRHSTIAQPIPAPRRRWASVRPAGPAPTMPTWVLTGGHDARIPTTLVISDLHLGARLGRDVLRDEAMLAALVGALSDVERLVLLGDTVELLEGRPRLAMAGAGPVLRAVGRALGPEREVVVVPGNHDRALLGAWLGAHLADLAPETPVPADASPALAAVTGWLAPARVSVSYPGVWLADGVWGHHGHYLDRHLLPQTAFGIARGRLGRRASEMRTAGDYEAGPHLTPLEGALTGRAPRVLSRGADALASATRAWSAGSPLVARVLGRQMVRAALPAFAEVATRLRPEAHTAVFGHVHRLGPLDGDDPAAWAGPPRILNTGCWVHEPVLLTRAGPGNPYWPGGAVRVDDDGTARAMSLGGGPGQ